ncbi:hypothetical protein SERLA73DRAFT_146090 [Serpula lacrymans var. lacrymans S7.3]|uniref:Eukaryotic mitochondrial regulator protein-domain-containing protein n=2 Tax=Serpula lacrymans var. lacrymans TaxID=341189 RepID=F8QF19_SERL3|nr:uncharacterized protein SERLADRAFT_376691 [Serpula lacrymans var. lacrymans S7.9]EGN93182.1 hypothetical protein SERLA73DRAFT_146090 [Serpula lacrymans var. lacrymans S7.3]EGO31081.1 hypothetical protein SERLADRAFT_376691 [Serpula lacrymans var. lacrymans S7.9]
MEEGYRYRDSKPRNWLGGEVPFPLNPSFKPPIPLSDTLRTLIYRQYMADPKMNSVRALATQYHLSIKRVDAILRLKGMEAHWAKENRSLQTGFVKGMEDVLGVTQHMRTRVSKSLASEDPTRHDVQEADAHDEQEGSDWARLRYQRMFWESIPEGEGKEPLMPDILEKARQDMEKQIKETRDAKSHPTLVPRFQGKDHDKIKFVKPEGRPAIKFVDVGGKFLDVNDRKRRIAESERRSKVKARRKEAAYASRTVS